MESTSTSLSRITPSFPTLLSLSHSALAEMLLVILRAMPRPKREPVVVTALFMEKPILGAEALASSLVVYRPSPDRAGYRC